MVMGALSLRALFRNESWMFCAGLVSIARYDTASLRIFQPRHELDAGLARHDADFRYFSEPISTRKAAASYQLQATRKGKSSSRISRISADWGGGTLLAW